MVNFQIIPNWPDTLMINAPETITRKELVALSGYRLSERTIRVHEREWGLYACRVRFCRKPVLYEKLRALLILRGLVGWK